MNTSEVSALSIIEDRSVLTDRVHEGLRRAILSLELPPGAPLVEHELARRFGVSKSPVRDALQRLAGEGLVDQLSHRGMTVVQIDRALADEIYLLREVLEPVAVRLATPRLTPVDIADANDYLAQAQDAIKQDDRTLLADRNRRFHLVFSARSGNRPLHDAIARLQDRVRIISVQSWRHRPAMRTEAEQHSAILAAATHGDADGAAELMAAHIRNFRQTPANTPFA